MPNDYIDQVKLTDNTVVDIKDTVSGYSKVFEIHATAITGTDYYTLDKSWSDISSAITNGNNLIISNIDATYPYTTINNSGIVFGATLIATNNGSTFALTDGILVINNQGTAMGMAIHMNMTIPTIPSSSAILKGDGSGGVTTATSGTDYQAPISFDGTYSSSNKAATVSTVTNAINALDGGTIGTGSTTKTITSLSQTDGNVSATFSDIAFPVTSVNTKTGAVSLTASDVGAQATLVSGTNIKTINNESLLGSGNIDISSGGSGILFVTVTYANYAYTADTTYANMMSAISNGKDIVLILVDANQQKTWYYTMTYAPKTTTENFCFASEDEFGTFKHLLVNNADAWWAADDISLSNYAKKASPTFTGTPKAPTAAAGTDTTQIATTAFVQGEKKNLIVSGDSSTTVASLSALTTQLNTWFATMSDATVAYFWLKVTTAFLPFQTGDKIVRLKRATSTWGFAEFFSDFGSTSTTNMRYFGGSEIAMSLVNGTWQDPVPTRAILANYYDYANRPTDANSAIPFAQYDGGLYSFKVTSSMTSNRPSPDYDGHIIHDSWDATGNYATQLFLPNASTNGTSNNGRRHAQVRGCYNGTWKDWESLAWTNESLLGFKTGDNSGTTSGIYKIFLRVAQNTTTSPCMGQFLVTGMSNVTQATQGLYILSVFNRNSTFTPSVLRIKGHYGNLTWGYYLADGYYYVGAYMSSNYTEFPDVWEISSNHSSTYGFELGEFVHSATQPTGWTTFTPDGLLATTDDINTAIGSAILASY